MESARSMLSHAQLPNRFWAEAIATAAYLRNHSATAAIANGKTPYEKWHSCKPNLEHLKVFGCAAYAHIPERSWMIKLKNFDLLVIARILKVTDCTMNRPTK